MGFKDDSLIVIVYFIGLSVLKRQQFIYETRYTLKKNDNNQKGIYKAIGNKTGSEGK